MCHLAKTHLLFYPFKVLKKIKLDNIIQRFCKVELSN